jgi:hypothetical protein
MPESFLGFCLKLPSKREALSSNPSPEKKDEYVSLMHEDK